MVSVPLIRRSGENVSERGKNDRGGADFVAKWQRPDTKIREIASNSRPECAIERDASLSELVAFTRVLSRATCGNDCFSGFFHFRVRRPPPPVGKTKFRDDFRHQITRKQEKCGTQITCAFIRSVPNLAFEGIGISKANVNDGKCRANRKKCGARGTCGMGGPNLSCQKTPLFQKRRIFPSAFPGDSLRSLRAL